MCAYLKLLTEAVAAGVLVLEMCAAAELGLFSIFTIFADKSDLNQNDSPKTTKAKNAETVRRAETRFSVGLLHKINLFHIMHTVTGCIVTVLLSHRALINCALHAVFITPEMLFLSPAQESHGSLSL